MWIGASGDAESTAPPPVTEIPHGRLPPSDGEAPTPSPWSVDRAFFDTPNEALHIEIQKAIGCPGTLRNILKTLKGVDPDHPEFEEIRRAACLELDSKLAHSSYL
jgi:hypothetical protein